MKDIATEGKGTNLQELITTSPTLDIIDDDIITFDYNLPDDNPFDNIEDTQYNSNQKTVTPSSCTEKQVASAYPKGNMTCGRSTDTNNESFSERYEPPQGNNTASISTSTLELEATYIGKMFAEVARAMSQRRFPTKNDSRPDIPMKCLDTLYDLTRNDIREFSSPLPFYHKPSLEVQTRDLQFKDITPKCIDDEYVSINEDTIVLEDAKSIEMPAEDMYSSNLMRGLARSKLPSGIEANLILSKVSVPLPSEWQLITPSQNLNIFGAPTRLRYNSESVKYFTKILSRHSPYCCWVIFENFVKKPESRKESSVYFRARGKCTVEGCFHNASLTIGYQNSSNMQISFNGNVLHKTW